MIDLQKPVFRKLYAKDASGRTRAMVAKLAPEGVYLKHKDERWSSALLMPWFAIYERAAWLAAEKKQREKREARGFKKLAKRKVAKGY